eukprot:INCI2958.3.p1 GENE.INCI2958.3~~INCI2958.3.p1  ORF type:complete len:405 (-),score=48.15 INCI2958.3:663-1877(-)
MNFLELTVPDASQFALGMRVPLLGGRASGFIVKLAFDNLHSRDNSRAGVLLVDDIKDPNGNKLTFYKSDNSSGYERGKVYRSAVTGVESKYIGHGHGCYFGLPLDDGWNWNPKQVPLRPAIKSPNALALQARHAKHKKHTDRRGSASRKAFARRGSGPGHEYVDTGRPRLTRFRSADVIRVFRQDEPANAHVHFESESPTRDLPQDQASRPQLTRALSTPSMKKLKKLDKLSETVNKIKTGYRKIAEQSPTKLVGNKQHLAKVQAVLAKYRGITGHTLFREVTGVSVKNIRSGRAVAASKRDQLRQEVLSLSSAIERTSQQLEATKKHRKMASHAPEVLEIKSRDVMKYRLGQTIPVLVSDGQATAFGTISRIKHHHAPLTHGTLVIDNLQDAVCSRRRGHETD